MTRVALSESSWQTYRDIYLSDPWEFALDICGLDLLVERFHKPLIYLMTGQTRLLCATLDSKLESEVLTQLRSDLLRRGLNWSSGKDFVAIDRLVHKQNDRLFRKGGKTSCGEAAILWDITVDPNQAWMLVSRDDPSAEEMCAFMGNIILSDAYRAFFPDRIPENPHATITRSSILLAGRTKNIPQPCVTAAGHDSGWTSMHFGRAYKDDLTGLENKSPLKLKVVRAFQANQEGLKMPEMAAQFLDVTVGSRWARQDDSAALEDDPDCLNLKVPIETYFAARDFANMLEPGEPTLPEWYDAAKIAEMKREYLKNKEEGPQALLANLFLVTADEGSSLFKSSSLRDSKFSWVIKKQGDTERTFVSRPAVDQKGKPILDDKKKQKVFLFDPHAELDVVMGVDPSVSLTGDAWAVANLGRDPFGVTYELETLTGRGLQPLIEAIKVSKEKWHPRVIGVEAAAMQILMLHILANEPSLQDMVGRIVAVPHKNIAKTTRMVGLVSAPLDQKLLLLNPRDSVPTTQMRDYDPSAANPQDAIIDAIGIGMTLYTATSTGQTDKELLKAAARDNTEYEARLDRDTGIEIDAFDEFDDDEFYLEEAM